MIITIDGFVATGKGTTAQGVANELGWMYMDTGAFYRALALFFVRNKADFGDHEALVELAVTTRMSYIYNNETNHHDVTLNGENVEHLIRSVEVSKHIPSFTFLKDIRQHLIGQMRVVAATATGGLVADGRDMGTVVFPHADLKVFLVCDTDVRVERRYQQLVGQGLVADKQSIRDDIEKRDWADYLGPRAPNKKADEAHELDTTMLSIDQQVEKIIQWFESLRK